MTNLEFCMKDFITDDFLQKFTSFKTYDEFINQPVFQGKSNTSEIPIKELDAFAKSISNSEFESFQELFEQAHSDYVHLKGQY